jgi:hypothetical protein
MKQAINHSKDGGLLKMIRRTDPVICNREVVSYSGTENHGVGSSDHYSWLIF